MNNLKEIWNKLCTNYTQDLNLIEKCWLEINSCYNEKSRHYHDLSHIENMVSLTFDNRDQIKNFDILLFSIFYHDIIYKAIRKDNEEKSAELAKDRLKLLGVPHDDIKKCWNQIIFTKAHSTSLDSDTNFLLDFDLAVLGGEWTEYMRYSIGVREEYKIYPDLLYKPGRRKVLEHFLEMKNIYKSDLFRSKFEKKAKENLSRELEELS
ncbi:MAG: hypothetical protein H6599_01790 [Flavobacteriales bacterium]|nr:hypothetical protein [Flavobacteriales bacterium]